jgi:hypothetical protein
VAVAAIYKSLTALHAAAHALHVHHQQQQQRSTLPVIRADTVLLPAMTLVLAISIPIRDALLHTTSTTGSSNISTGIQLSITAAFTMCTLTAAALCYSAQSVLQPLLILFGCAGSTLQLVLLVITLFAAHTYAVASVCSRGNLLYKQFSAVVILVCILLGLVQVRPTFMQIYVYSDR